jgi:hypothetical protein
LPVLDYGRFLTTATVSEGLPNPHVSLDFHVEVLGVVHLYASPSSYSLLRVLENALGALLGCNLDKSMVLLTFATCWYEGSRVEKALRKQVKKKLKERRVWMQRIEEKNQLG